MVFSRKKGSFTLIELLVAVSIFSGIIVLTLGAFARSANSSLKSTAVRERTEAARTIVDRIGNDIQYLYVDIDFNAGTSECHNSTSPVPARGLFFNGDCLFMLLKYPDSPDLIRKKYSRAIRTIGTASYDTLSLEEARRCSEALLPAISCDSTTLSQGTVIGDKYLLAKDSEPSYSDAANKMFTGLNPYDAANQIPAITGILRLNVVVKGTDVAGQLCQLTSSYCYTIKTSFVVGN